MIYIFGGNEICLLHIQWTNEIIIQHKLTQMGDMSIAYSMINELYFFIEHFTYINSRVFFKHIKSQTFKKLLTI